MDTGQEEQLPDRLVSDPDIWLERGDGEARVAGESYC